MYDTYADDIFRYIYVRVRDKELAEDLTADTFTKAWQKLDSFDFRHARAWLYTIARNRLTDHWRTKHTIPLDEEVEVPDDRETVDELLDKQTARTELLESLAELPEQMRSVVSLRFLQGYSAKKTGEVLHLSEANVRVLQYRALKKLRGLLQ